MSLFHRHTPEPQPKDEPPTGLDIVAEKLAEMNRLQAAEHRYKRDGSHIMTNAIQVRMGWRFRFGLVGILDSILGGL